ncbi:MAG: DNA alkylation repair protein [bacterium]|nr:DNA alkylation repair protein [bacterium]
MREEILQILKEKADGEYQAFSDRITNNQTGNRSMGVRVPALRALGKEIAGGKYGDFRTYLQEIDVLMARDRLEVFQEEHMLYGMLIGMAKMENAERRQYMDAWIPRILSWGDCDCGTSTWKFIKKDLDAWYPYVLQWLEAKEEFSVRCGLVLLMQYFITDAYIDRVLAVYEKTYSDAYYVRMGQAWALSVCYVKYPEKTLNVFERRTLDAWVQNKAIQKCRESFRVSKADKEMLKTFKM